MANNNSSIHHFVVSQNFRTNGFSMKAPHSHSFYEFFYIAAGRCTLIVDDEKYMMTDGDVAIIKPNHPHRTIYSLNCTTERICLECSEDLLRDLFAHVNSFKFEDITEYPLRHAEFQTRYALEHALLTLLNIKEIKSPYSKELLNTTIVQAILLFLCCDSALTSAESSSTVHSSNIEKALEYIHLNYSRKLTLSELAGILHLNPTYFSKLFRDSLGKGFADYVLELRIIKAEGLLLETDKPITEIAYSCGFGSSNYFCEAFHRKNGVSPIVFRKLKGNVL